MSLPDPRTPNQRRMDEAAIRFEEARRRRPERNPFSCWCPDGPRPNGAWDPDPDCPIHNGPCECGAPRRADGTLSCAR